MICFKYSRLYGKMLYKKALLKGLRINMKKIACFLLLCIMILSVFACGNDMDALMGTIVNEQITTTLLADIIPESTVAPGTITEEDKKNAKFCGNTELLEPVNGLIKAGTFEVLISTDIAEKISYASYETSVELYFREDIRYFYDSTGTVVYSPAKLCTISADSSVYRLIVGPENAWIIGDAEEYQELNVHVQGVLGQVCVLKGSQNTCPKEMIVGEDGRVHGSMMTDYYETYEDMLKIEKRMYYLLELSDGKELSNPDKKDEYTEIRSSLIKNSKIVE